MDTNKNTKTGLFLAALVIMFGVAFTGGVAGTILAPQLLRNTPLGKLIGNTPAGLITEVTRQKVVDEESATIDVTKAVSPSVVSIVIKTTSFNPFTGPVSEEQGIGTGFVIDANGVVLTNRHVVEDTNASYTVVTKDKKSYDVIKIDRDPTHDLAILKVDGTGLAAVSLGDSDRLEVGQKVIAIGYALGEFPNTVTTGVVSGLGRSVTASSGIFGQAETLSNIIQTDAALNPGNSGGPLLDYSGNVVGINVAITQGAQNIGFAIPINGAKSIISDFLANGKITRSYLGIEYVSVSSEVAQARGLKIGAYISRVVANSPAEKAGIKAGDIITRFDGTELSSTDGSLTDLIVAKKPGDRIAIQVWRNNGYVDLNATLEQAQN